jgi:hypothetical protein
MILICPRPCNTRMQRTRSSPSALRSRLMRCPLGGTATVALHNERRAPS